MCVCVAIRGGKGRGGGVGKEKYFSSILLYPFFTPSPPKGHKKKKNVRKEAVSPDSTPSLLFSPRFEFFMVLLNEVRGLGKERERKSFWGLRKEGRVGGGGLVGECDPVSRRWRFRDGKIS